MPIIIDSNGNIKESPYIMRVTDFANGTDGELITWDTSGNPATISVGTSTHVLTSNGAGSTPTFQASAGGGPSQSTQSAIEAETDENTYTPPDLIKHTPGCSKAWVKFDGTGTPSITTSYNTSSITDHANGTYTVVWDTDFSSATYAIAGMAEELAAANDEMMLAIDSTTALATTGARVVTTDIHNAQDIVDTDKIFVIAWGDHA
jgi:hypothetical protein